MATDQIDFTDENIQRLFGFEDAESEPIDRLRDYYLKNDIYKRATSDLPIRIIVGHKGIGKSALFKVSISEERDKGNLPILIRPDDIAELGKSDDNFLLKVRQWRLGLTKIIGSKVFHEFGYNDESAISKLSQFGIKLVNHLTESLTVVKDNLNLEPVQQRIMQNFLKNGKVIVYIDDLDRGWEAQKSDIQRISALLNSIRDLSNEIPGLRFRISLRSDVYFLVRTSDESTDKIEGAVVWYSWTNHEILVILVKRIITFFGKKINQDALIKNNQASLSYHLDSIMDPKFAGKGSWEITPTYRMLMSLVRKRPRDMVKLCTLAAREAKRANSSKIQTEHFKAILPEYSQGRIQDAINEYRSELPLVDKLLFGMKPTTKEIQEGEPFVYTTATLHKKLTFLSQQNTFYFTNSRVKATDKELAHFLYKINFLTARKNLDDGFIDRKYYEENRYLSTATKDFGYNWEVHPAYRWALQPDSLDSIYEKLKHTND